MAVSKMTTWVYEMQLRNPTGSYSNDELHLTMKFAVYADLGNASANPYVRLENCDFCSHSNAVVSERVAANVRIQINGSGTTYNFSTGSAIQRISGVNYTPVPDSAWYYTARFSSGTNIPINKTRTEFTFNLTVTTRNGETYTKVLPACGIVPQTLSGPNSLVCGSIATYNFSSAVRNEFVSGEPKYQFIAWVKYGEEIQKYADGSTKPYYWFAAEAFTEPYQLARQTTSNVSSVSFVPFDYSGHQYAKSNGGYACLDYYYIPANTTTHIYGTGDLISYSILESDVSATRYIYPTAIDRGLCISFIRKRVTVSTRSTSDANLRPVFKRFDHYACAPAGSNVYQSSTNIYDQMIAKYGGVVQGARDGYILAEFYADEAYNKYRENRPSGAALKYADYFKTGTVTENFTGTSRTIAMQADLGMTINTSMSYIAANCNVAEFSSAGTNKKATFTLLDAFGFSTTVTDTVTVLPYHRPSLALYRARRCRVATSGDTEVYTYNGVRYTPDESGAYALIEWRADISALNNQNSKTLKVRMRETDAWETINVSSYTASGFLVKAAAEDSSFDVQFSVSDDFFSNVIFIAPLNTVYAMMDFKRGGRGVAMGKVSELDFVYDIHRNWLLHMPYNTYVQGYNSNGTAVNLYDWMQRVNQRITGIINSRDVMLFARYAISGSSRWANGNASVCVPTSYCRVTEEDKLTITGAQQTIRIGAWMNQNAITVNRPYLNITLGTVSSYAYNTSGGTTYRPTVYICSSKPTSFNQSTGAPNATILAQQTYNMEKASFNGYYAIGGYDVGFYVWNSRYPGSYITYSYSLNLSSYQGQNIWIVVRANTGYCPVPSDTSAANWDSVADELTMGQASISVNEIWLSNKRV